MLIFFHLALRRMAERHRQPQPKADTLVPVLRPAGPMIPAARIARPLGGGSEAGAPRAPRPYKRRNKGL